MRSPISNIIVMKYFPHLLHRKLKGRVLLDPDGHIITSDVVKEIDWLPKTYQVAVDSSTLSKDRSLELLSSMLKNECLLGNVVRQELVSMIPALLLDVKASHLVPYILPNRVTLL